MDAIMAGAVFTAFVTGMQMRVVLDVQGNRFQDGCCRSRIRVMRSVVSDMASIVKVPARAGRAMGRKGRTPWPGRVCQALGGVPAPSSAWMCLPSQRDWPMTNTIIRPIRPKALKLTHWDSVKCPENAT